MFRNDLEFFPNWFMQTHFQNCRQE